jgi:hypothetical protein
MSGKKHKRDDEDEMSISSMPSSSTLPGMSKEMKDQLKYNANKTHLKNHYSRMKHEASGIAESLGILAPMFASKGISAAGSAITEAWRKSSDSRSKALKKASELGGGLVSAAAKGGHTAGSAIFKFAKANPKAAVGISSALALAAYLKYKRGKKGIQKNPLPLVKPHKKHKKH